MNACYLHKADIQALNRRIMVYFEVLNGRYILIADIPDSLSIIKQYVI